MGFAGEDGVYNRWRGGTWQRGADEIARLAGIPGPLYGVLGYADPEVVCKRGDQCIIKRRSGWKNIPALPSLPEVALCDGQAWAFEPNRLWALEQESWQPVTGAPVFNRVSSVWGASRGDVWVADAGRGVLHHFAGSAWAEQPAPIDGPRAVWAPSSSEVWLAGDGGVARYDGKQWTRAAGAPQGASVLVGRDAKAIWLAGPSGVWRGEHASSP
jgi:hypothetical protein